MGASTINKLLLAFEADRTRGFEKAEPMWKPHDFINPMLSMRDPCIYLHSLSKPTKIYRWIYMDGMGVGRVSAFCAMFSREALLGSQLIRGDPGRSESRFTQKHPAR